MFMFVILDPEFLEQFENHPNYNPETKSFDHLGDNCFDGTWMAGLAINCTIATLQKMGK